MRNQTNLPPTKNAPFAILTVGGGVQAIVLDKDGKAQITNAQAVKLDDVADFADAVKGSTPAYTVIGYAEEHKLAHLAKLTGYNLKRAFEQFGAYCHAENHGYKFLSNAIVHTFSDTAPVFEVTTKDGNKRYYQCGKRIPAHLFDYHCANDSVQYLKLAEQTKQTYTKPYRGDKMLVKRKALRTMRNITLTVGYCQLQALLNPLSPSAYYGNNVYGWQADGYVISPSHAIVTGYSNIGTHIIPPQLAYIAERKALKANALAMVSHDEHMEKLADIMACLITDTLAYHQCHFG